MISRIEKFEGWFDKKSISESKISVQDQHYDKLRNLAIGRTFDEFLDKTDSVAFDYDMLYRGSIDGSIPDESFMTDYIGHAREYGDKVDGLLYNRSDLLYFDDIIFDNLRSYLRGKLSMEAIRSLYAPYFRTKLIDGMRGDLDTEDKVIEYVYHMINSTDSFEDAIKSKEGLDSLVPLLTHYAKSKGKNIISFYGNDYDGDQLEFVVIDPDRYIKLSDFYNVATS
jgi:hypothetical protein